MQALIVKGCIRIWLQIRDILEETFSVLFSTSECQEMLRVVVKSPTRDQHLTPGLIVGLLKNGPLINQIVAEISDSSISPVSGERIGYDSDNSVTLQDVVNLLAYINTKCNRVDGELEKSVRAMVHGLARLWTTVIFNALARSPKLSVFSTSESADLLIGGNDLIHFIVIGVQLDLKALVESVEIGVTMNLETLNSSSYSAHVLPCFALLTNSLLPVQEIVQSVPESSFLASVDRLVLLTMELCQEYSTYYSCELSRAGDVFKGWLTSIFRFPFSFITQVALKFSNYSHYKSSSALHQACLRYIDMPTFEQVSFSCQHLYLT